MCRRTCLASPAEPYPGGVLCARACGQALRARSHALAEPYPTLLLCRLKRRLESAHSPKGESSHPASGVVVARVPPPEGDATRTPRAVCDPTRGGRPRAHWAATSARGVGLFSRRLTQIRGGECGIPRRCGTLHRIVGLGTLFWRGGIDRGPAGRLRSRTTKATSPLGSELHPRAG